MKNNATVKPEDFFLNFKASIAIVLIDLRISLLRLSALSLFYQFQKKGEHVLLVFNIKITLGKNSPALIKIISTHDTEKSR